MKGRHWSEPGRFSWLRRVFGSGENFFDWGVPLYEKWGIRVQLHIFFLVYIIAMLVKSIPQGNLGIGYMAMSMGILFGIVLLHEYGHCIACRWVDGTADKIVLWPLGGLAYCAPPHHWKASFITTAGGPLVNVVLWPILGCALVLLTHDMGSVFFNPFRPSFAISNLTYSWGGSSWVLTGVWFAYYINLILLAFNVLVPMYPMDCGRLIQALLWRKLGHSASMDLSTTIGLIAAVVMGVFGLVFNEVILLSIALFGGLTCWFERQRLKMFQSGSLGDVGEAWKGGLHTDRGFGVGKGDDAPDRGPSRREIKAAEREKLHQEEVDRILAKIAREGMGALTSKEKKVLQRDTEQKRSG